MKYGIKIHVRSSFTSKTGTMVVKEEKKLEKEVVTGFHPRLRGKYFSQRYPDKPELQEIYFLYYQELI